MCNHPPMYAAPQQEFPAYIQSTTIPPMRQPTGAVAEPESASITLLRALLADRRSSARAAGENRDSYNRQADDYERIAKETRERAESAGATVSLAESEISAILADIKTLGGRDE